MALAQTTRDYEILIRLNADGTYGAQLQTITEITNDGAVIAATVNAPISLCTAAETEGALLTTVLGDTVTNALTSNESLQAQVATLTDEVSTLTEQASTLTAQVSSLTDEKTSLSAQVAELQAQLATANTTSAT